ncbi:MAG TPA: helix-turn-helix transcriptional regulator [Thermoanaerobaculia bacterium]|jgi:transcriptional regulator with XRE-family HTH domain|nr:helix-turn-helix transcriptional regulator [Thermoanaerobaculia bacterium]
MAAAGFCHLTLSAPKPLPPEYPGELRSLGDHLRTERLKRGLLQKEVAAIIGVEVSTVVGWEVGRAEPKVSYLPAILAFIGYDPFPEAKSFGERLRVERWKRGLTQYQLARQLGVYKDTITLLETGKEVTNERVLEAVRAFLEGREVCR